MSVLNHYTEGAGSGRDIAHKPGTSLLPHHSTIKHAAKSSCVKTQAGLILVIVDN